MSGERILVVDDDPAILLALSTILRRAGYDVATHDSGFGLAMALRQFVPSVVLLDVDMPGLRGDAALRAASELDENVCPPVVLCSGLPDHELAERARRMGAADYLVKPVNRDQIVGCLERVIADANDRALG